MTNGNGAATRVIVISLMALMGLAGAIGTFAYSDTKATAAAAVDSTRLNKDRIDSLSLALKLHELDYYKQQYQLNQTVANIAKKVGAESMVDTTLPPGVVADTL